MAGPNKLIDELEKNNNNNKLGKTTIKLIVFLIYQAFKKFYIILKKSFRDGFQTLITFIALALVFPPASALLRIKLALYFRTDL